MAGPAIPPTAAQGHPQPQAPGLGQRGLAQALPGVAGQGVGHFVGDHRGHAGLVPGVFQDAGEDADLAPGQTEGVGLFAFKDHKFPAVIGALGRVGDAPAHPGHQGVHFRVLGNLVLTLELLEGLVAHRGLATFGGEQELATTGIGRSRTGRHQQGEPQDY